MILYFRISLTHWQTEFEDTILEDLQLMGIHGDVVTHTSDYFDQLYELAVKLISLGQAYADDTEKEQAGDHYNQSAHSLIIPPDATRTL